MGLVLSLNFEFQESILVPGNQMSPSVHRRDYTFPSAYIYVQDAGKTLTHIKIMWKCVLVLKQ